MAGASYLFSTNTTTGPFQTTSSHMLSQDVRFYIFKTPRAGRATESRIEELVTYMENHNLFPRGKFLGKDGTRGLSERWKALTVFPEELASCIHEKNLDVPPELENSIEGRGCLEIPSPGKSTQSSGSRQYSVKKHKTPSRERIRVQLMEAREKFTVLQEDSNKTQLMIGEAAG
ncbi:uncharacterized protein [Anabrus simplex]|uniref:uncharacterized protein n=1 Tax=Anabrus simplex TaxID=316456 RepID=UPI0035A26893